MSTFTMTSIGSLTDRVHGFAAISFIAPADVPAATWSRARQVCETMGLTVIGGSPAGGTVVTTLESGTLALDPVVCLLGNVGFDVASVSATEA